MMRPSRRDILKMLLASPLALTLDVEKVLWVPTPQIVVPPMRVRLGGVVWFIYTGDGTVYRYTHNIPAGVKVGDLLIGHTGIFRGVIASGTPEGDGWLTVSEPSQVRVA